MDSKLTFVLLFLVSSVSSHSDGAGLSACTTLIPGHGYNAQTSSSPYSVTTSTSKYLPGGAITVTLAGSQAFKGFLLLATNSSNGDLSQTVGQLEALNQEDKNFTKNMCDGNRSLTHSQPLTTDSLLVKWTAPDQSAGDIKFYATFVEEFQTYWVKVASEVVQEEGTTSTPENPSTSTSTASSTSAAQTSNTTTADTGSSTTSPGDSSTTSPDDGTTTPTHSSTSTTSADGDFSPITQDGCGESKSCWMDCSSSTSCDYLVTWVKKGDNYNFEMMAANVDGYAALGIAPTPLMSDVSIFACTTIGVKQYYAPSPVPPTFIQSGPINFGSGTNSMKYDAATKTMSCRFTYDNKVAKSNSKNWKDLSAAQEFMFLARGLLGGKGAIQKHTTMPKVTAAKVDFNIIANGATIASINGILVVASILASVNWWLM